MKHGSWLAQLPGGLLDVCPKNPSLVGILPAFAGHTLHGLLVVGWRDAVAVAYEEMDFLRATADGLGLSLARSSLSRQTEMSEVVLDTACAVARSVSGTLDLEHTFQQIAMSAARVMGDCRCLLLVADADSDELAAVSSSDPAAGSLVGLRVAPEDAKDLLDAEDGLRSILVDDVVWSARTTAEDRQRLGMRSALFMPVHAEGELIGALLFYTADRRGQYSARDIARAETLAEQAASAIANARLFRDLAHSQGQTRALLERVTRVRQEQRQELAREIHDDIVQTVVAALFETEGLRAQVAPGLQSDTDHVTHLLRHAIADARHVIGDLRPPVLGNLGLVDAVIALADRLSSSISIEVEAQLGDAPHLTPEIEVAVYAIVREALQNTLKHSQASHVHVGLSWVAPHTDGPRNVLLSVSDDGVGNDSASVRHAGHFGITMMEEQASMVGGVLSLRSSPGNGYSVEALIPVPDSACTGGGRQ